VQLNCINIRRGARRLLDDPRSKSVSILFVSSSIRSLPLIQVALRMNFDWVVQWLSYLALHDSEQCHLSHRGLLHSALHLWVLHLCKRPEHEPPSPSIAHNSACGRWGCEHLLAQDCERDALDNLFNLNTRKVHEKPKQVFPPATPEPYPPRGCRMRNTGKEEDEKYCNNSSKNTRSINSKCLKHKLWQRLVCPPNQFMPEPAPEVSDRSSVMHWTE